MKYKSTNVQLAAIPDSPKRNNNKLYDLIKLTFKLY